MNFHCTEYGIVLWNKLYAMKSHDGSFFPDLDYINKTLGNGVCIPCTSQHQWAVITLILSMIIGIWVIGCSMGYGIAYIIRYLTTPVSNDNLRKIQMKQLLINVEKQLNDIANTKKEFLANANKKARKRFRRTENRNRIKYECPICLDHQINVELVPCKHQFCFNCIKEYNDICSCCRREVNWINVRNKFTTKN